MSQWTRVRLRWHLPMEDRNLSAGKQAGRSLSWTDGNVSVQELIIYQYSEERVSPFAERKFGMG